MALHPTPYNEDENKDEEPMFEKPLDWDDEEDGLWLPPDGPEIAERAYLPFPPLSLNPEL